MSLNEKYTKEYFSREGTVSKWWEPEFDRPEWKRQLLIEERLILRSIFDPKGKKIIDVGTGKGRFAIDFALAGATQIHALDISRDMLNVARERARQVRVADRIVFQRGDGEHLQFGDDIFDAAICMHTFVHLPNPQGAMDELARVVKLNGIVIANITTSGKLWRLRYRYQWSPRRKILAPIYFSRLCNNLRPFFHEKMGYPLTRPNPLTKCLSQREFRSLFKNAQLKISKTINQGPWYSPVLITMVAKKTRLG